MGETLHVAYKKYKIKRNLLFWGVNTTHISSRDLKTSEFSTHSINYIWNSPQKRKDPRYNVAVSVKSRSLNMFSRKSDEYAITKSITTIPT